MARSVTQRQWNKEFDRPEALRMLGAAPMEGLLGMGRLPSGRTVTVSPSKPGRVAVALSDPFTQRVFPVSQMAQAREWCEAGGELKSETDAARIRAAAPELLEALESIERALVQGYLTQGQFETYARAAIAKARGK